MKDLSQQFEAIYNDNKDDLYIYLVRNIRDENLAWDLLQDAFLNFVTIFKTKPLPEKVACRMYLFRVARNLMINNSRTAYNRRVQLADPSQSEQNISFSSMTGVEEGVLNSMEQEETEGKLRMLLSELSEEERTALILRHYHDMKLEEISQILEVSVPTVSRMIKKASRRLSSIIKQKGIVF